MTRSPILWFFLPLLLCQPTWSGAQCASTDAADHVAVDKNDAPTRAPRAIVPKAKQVEAFDANRLKYSNTIESVFKKLPVPSDTKNDAPSAESFILVPNPIGQIMPLIFERVVTDQGSQFASGRAVDSEGLVSKTQIPLKERRFKHYRQVNQITDSRRNVWDPGDWFTFSAEGKSHRGRIVALFAAKSKKNWAFVQVFAINGRNLIPEDDVKYAVKRIESLEPAETPQRRIIEAQVVWWIGGTPPPQSFTIDLED